MDLSTEIYDGGFFSLVRKFERKRTRLIGVDDALPEKDVDLEKVQHELVLPPTNLPEDFEKDDVRSRQSKLQTEFQGQSQLLYLHALLISVLRRKNPPKDTLTLFFRIWREKGSFLAEELNIRWKISAATTFADHGVTLEQRALGMGLSVLFDTIKMHDSERRLTGRPGHKPFRRNRDKTHHSVAFDLEPYSLVNGDLDRNMLARFWILAEADETIFPLARSMLFSIMTDERSIFARLQQLKPRKPRKSLKEFF